MSSSLEARIIGVSPAIARLRRDIAQIAPASLSVLVEGETGSGKELVAAALHQLSGRRGAFVPVNAASISEGLFESHLFGHVRGAFTGAIADTRGFVQEAKSGTLFLDEISSTPLSAQAKLLRVLESGQVRPVGAQSDRATDFRLVAAANVSLHSEVESLRFRADLLYRVCGDLLKVPPLRERSEDIGMLAKHFAQLRCREIKRDVTLSCGAIRVLEAFAWPGNVRQLRAVIDRAVIGAEADDVRAADISEILDRLSPRTGTMARMSERAAQLFALLQQHAWDTVRVAAELGITRKTVYSRIQKYDLRIPAKYTRRSDVSSLLPVADGARSVTNASSVAGRSRLAS